MGGGSSSRAATKIVDQYFSFSICRLEAVYCGCLPVVPNRLSYVEIYGNKIEEMYDTEEQLFQILSNLCTRKRNGNHFRNYKHLALPYESNKWFEEIYNIIEH